MSKCFEITHTKLDNFYCYANSNIDFIKCKIRLPLDKKNANTNTHSHTCYEKYRADKAMLFLKSALICSNTLSVCFKKTEFFQVFYTNSIKQKSQV